MNGRKWVNQGILKGHFTQITHQVMQMGLVLCPEVLRYPPLKHLPPILIHTKLDL